MNLTHRVYSVATWSLLASNASSYDSVVHVISTMTFTFLQTSLKTTFSRRGSLPFCNMSYLSSFAAAKLHCQEVRVSNQTGIFRSQTSRNNRIESMRKLLYYLVASVLCKLGFLSVVPSQCTSWVSVLSGINRDWGTYTISPKFERSCFNLTIFLSKNKCPNTESCFPNDHQFLCMGIQSHRLHPDVIRLCT